MNYTAAPLLFVLAAMAAIVVLAILTAPEAAPDYVDAYCWSHYSREWVLCN